MTPARRRPRREMTPADVTQRFPSFNGRRIEAWQAKSRDGIWRYDRLEISGTPWMAVHLPTETEGPWYGTLGAARAGTADGTALAYVELARAHGRGEHGTARVPACGRC